MVEESSINTIDTSKINKEEEGMKEKTPPKKTLKLERFFTKEDIQPFDEVEWSTTRVQIKNLDSEIIFDHEVEHPVKWNEMAVRTCADKYFKTYDLENHPLGGERSVRDVIHRVAHSISRRGIQMEYFDEDNGKILYDELCYLMIHQIGAFNSPVFFNWGLYDVYGFKGNSKAKRWAIKDRDQEVYQQEYEYENPQGSACKSGDTSIYTNSGAISLESLVESFNSGKTPDIKVMTSSGFSNVIAAKYNGIKPTYKISFKDGNELRITEDDEIFVCTNKHDGRFITVENLLKIKNLDSFQTKTKFYNSENWEKFESIEYYGEEKVYDIETEAHDFYANGILVHNCFITEVTDELINGKNGIYDWVQTEMSIFANGSGSGLNVSRIRGKNEPITGGGKSSGLISFLEVADASAGVIKSGGKNRRAAKVLVLDDKHPDLIDFINWKKEEEFKARVLMLGGYTQNWSCENGAYKSVKAQNANNSVAVTDDFMNAVINNEDWELKYVTSGNKKETIKARYIFDQMVEANWECGDPGIFFIDTVNKWNTIPNTGKIRSGNPCMEFLQPDLSSCNLASLNLIKFINKDKIFDAEMFKATIEFFITAMEIVVGGSSYPSEGIAEMTKNTRPLGLGYCNMGGLAMILGYPYDSDQTRSIISTVTSLQTSIAYAQSAKIASIVGPFNDYQKNKIDFIKIIKKHSEMNSEIKPRIKIARQIHQAATESWAETTNLIQKHGARNSQVVVIAPSGTIMFLMGTTNNGIEPAYSLSSYKLMSDGSMIELLCDEAKIALSDLGYNNSQVEDISNYILKEGHIEGAPHLNLQHYPIFDTANVDGNGTRCINTMAHINAVAAATPFISGGISKTINLPEYATKEDIYNSYIEGWKKGCKGLALYRSGSKWSQPLNSKNNNFKREIIHREIERTKQRLKQSDFRKKSPGDFWEYHRGLLTRKKAADRAPAERLNFRIGEENVWINIVRYPNNGVSELWLEVGKENPTVNGLADTIGRICSVAIQYGVPIEAICSTMEGLQFSPAGFLGKNDLGLRSAKSLSDLTSKVLSRLNLEYNGKTVTDITPIWDGDNNSGEEPVLVPESDQAKSRGFSGIRCEECGSWRTKGTVKCGICIACQTAYGTCNG